MYRIILFLILGIDASILFYQISTLSISSHEVSILYGEFSFLQLVLQFSLSIFENKDIGLRIPMILLHIFSILLLYNLSRKYLNDKRNRLWLVLIFTLLPGIVSSALIVDSAGLIIFGLFLFLNIYTYFEKKYSYILLSLLSLVDGGFIYLFLSLSFFSYNIKDKFFLLFNIILFFISFFIYGIKTNGAPEGYFLDTIGLYSAVLSPIIFIYIFYVLYKKYFSKELDLIWFISTIPFLFSLLISFRQKISIEEFAPYIIVALIISSQTFYSSYRVRLNLFRYKYKIIFKISFIFLILNFLIVMFNREIYMFIENPKKNFAYKMHIAKELSKELKDKHISCVRTDNTMAKRLEFYDIKNCNNNILKENNIENSKKSNVTISYRSRIIYSGVVTKSDIK